MSNFKRLFFLTECGSLESILLFVSFAIGGICILLIIILIVVIAKTRQQITTLHKAIKHIKDGHEYPMPLTKVPLKSTSSQDSGFVIDPVSNAPERPGQQPIRQNTYVDEGQQNRNTPYEKLVTKRESVHNYEPPSRILPYESGKYYAQLSDDVVSRASSHDYEVLPGINSQPGSKTGSLRSRANVPLSIAEQKEDNVPL